MDHSTLKQYEKLGPFEIKDFVAKVASKAAQEASIAAVWLPRSEDEPRHSARRPAPGREPSRQRCGRSRTYRKASSRCSGTRCPAPSATFS